MVTAWFIRYMGWSKSGLSGTWDGQSGLSGMWDGQSGLSGTWDGHSLESSRYYPPCLLHVSRASESQ